MSTMKHYIKLIIIYEPVRINQVQHVWWDFVDNGQVAAESTSATWGGPGFKMWLN